MAQVTAKAVAVNPLESQLFNLINKLSPNDKKNFVNQLNAIFNKRITTAAQLADFIKSLNDTYKKMFIEILTKIVSAKQKSSFCGFAGKATDHDNNLIEKHSNDDGDGDITPPPTTDGMGTDPSGGDSGSSGWDWSSALKSISDSVKAGADIYKTYESGQTKPGTGTGTTAKPTTTKKPGLSTPAIIGIVAGTLAVLGLFTWLIFKK